jgi:hypothetical protein
VSELVKVLTLIKATGGDPKLVLVGFSLAMANVCEGLAAHGAEDPAIANVMDDIAEMYKEAEKYA